MHQACCDTWHLYIAALTRIHLPAAAVDAYQQHTACPPASVRSHCSAIGFCWPMQVALLFHDAKASARLLMEQADKYLH
jgi:hypothetical protein